MKMSDTKKINPLYQDIGADLNLGLLNSVDVIQTLWGGYGELVRLTFLDKSVIVKHVKLPKPSQHPCGWNSDFSHQRKLHSYQVEVNWYQGFSTPSDERCRIPQGLKCFQTENEWLIVMEDLAEAGFGSTTTQANKNHLRASLYWLANFHARYMHTQSNLVWEVGTYWHLETRLDELKVLKKSALKDFAQHIDDTLKRTCYQTLVHGDAKLANFCFDDDGSHCAAVDFQYVGHGCGMKDVVLFMSSAVEPASCAKMQEWRALFAVAWADFQRFIKGWSPNHYKINPCTESLTASALTYLRSKR